MRLGEMTFSKIFDVVKNITVKFKSDYKQADDKKKKSKLNCQRSKVEILKIFLFFLQK